MDKFTPQVVVFGKCPEGKWHLISECCYQGQAQDVSIYVQADSVKIVIDGHEPFIHKIDPRKLVAIDQDPMHQLMSIHEIRYAFIRHVLSHTGYKLPDLSKYMLGASNGNS